MLGNLTHSVKGLVGEAVGGITVFAAWRGGGGRVCDSKGGVGKGEGGGGGRGEEGKFVLYCVCFCVAKQDFVTPMA